MLGIAHGDNLAVDLDTTLVQFLSHHIGVDRTVGNTCGTHLHGDFEHQVFQLVGTFLRSSLLCLNLVSLLAQVLSEHLLGRRRSDDSLSLRDEIVTSVAGLHVHDFVFVTQTDDVFFQYKFHISSSFYYFIKSVT